MNPLLPFYPKFTPNSSFSNILNSGCTDYLFLYTIFKFLYPVLGCRCKMYPDLVEKKVTSETMILGVAPPKGFVESTMNLNY